MSASWSIRRASGSRVDDEIKAVARGALSENEEIADLKKFWLRR